MTQSSTPLFNVYSGCESLIANLRFCKDFNNVISD